MSSLRRFIAGAVCPACQAQDKLFIQVLDNNNVCECVACGFRDVQRRDAQPGTEEYSRALGAGDGADVVRIVNP